MLNKTPLWKYFTVIGMILLCGLYALPNLYGEDFAIQISSSRDTTVSAEMVADITSHLESANISFRRIEFKDERILVRVNDSDTQLIARRSLDDVYGDDYFVAMNLAPDTPEWLANLGATPMKLGLDLRGGVHFLMEVDMKTAIEKSLDGAKSDLENRLREEKLRYRGIRVVGDDLEITFRAADVLESAQFYLRNNYGEMAFTEKDDLTLRASYTPQRLSELRDYAVKQNITIIRNRVNQLGVAEPLVQKQGQERIVVQLPGIQDTAKAKEILNATATLEFRLVDLDGDLASAVRGRVPPRSKLLYTRDGRPQLLKKDIMLEGSHIVDANSSMDENGFPQVNIDLDGKGGSLMSKGTKDNVGKPMATVFIEYEATDKEDTEGNTIFEKKEEIINVATIQAQLGSSFRITGIDSVTEARDLSLLLRAGALIAPIQIVEERTVGPSLGKENIELGQTAILYGLIAVLIFMLIYYRAFGVVANIALMINVIMIVGIMSMMPGAALSLPGMAGIVLTVGMAVDANVLIFERIREELREGRSPQQAIHHGYDNAFSTILDANITTFIAGLILFAIGTGPIKGFSITLMIGIITSMFTAILVTRVLVNAVWGGRRVEKLAI
ncbi:protein translocase subunit SecD [Agaribacter marinus]|uniref:Protein translocase subunit SecD n=1 Tax=Agaribacter marinus TaxID=1431249 RepID=A0AA37WLR1_9ALTE|nr:protein translocase subunit SecD [Agaribacter marinus]GLR72934.1 protein translocase subunit SecD [Agaribacter marinus]